MRSYAWSSLAAAACMAAIDVTTNDFLPLGARLDTHDGRPDHAQPSRPKKRGTFKQKARQQIRANAKKKARR